jgi:two-component system invasion response regulator UvrY
MSASNRIRVILVDDHGLVRHGVRRLLEDARDVEVIAEAGSGEEALALVRQLEPDVLLMDLVMPGMGGLEATRKLSRVRPATRVIVVSMQKDEVLPAKLIDAGAMGYLTKGASVKEMVQAIREVFAGRRYLGAEVAQTVALSRLPGGDKSPFDSLTQREMEIAMMVMQGQRPGDISTKLCLSPKTVSTHRTNLFRKLGVANDVEFARLALRYGMIDSAG